MSRGVYAVAAWRSATHANLIDCIYEHGRLAGRHAAVAGIQEVGIVVTS